MIAEFSSQHAYHEISHDRQVMQTRVLRALQEHAGTELVDVDAAAFMAYLEDRLDEVAPSTVAREAKAIRPFFTWAQRAGHITAEHRQAIADVPLPRGSTARSQPRPYTRTEVQAFWGDLSDKYPLLEPEIFRGRVLRWGQGEGRLVYGRSLRPHLLRVQLEAIASIALFCGLRRDEIYRLGYEDMHPENSVVAVQGARKNRAAKHLRRSVPMHPVVRAKIEHWYDLRALVLDHEDREDHGSPWLSLWSPWIGQPLSIGAFRESIAKIGGPTRTERWSLHRMRHTAATEMLRSGMLLEQVRVIMGHSSLQQTLEYAQLLTGDLVASAHRAERGMGAALAPKVAA